MNTKEYIKNKLAMTHYSDAEQKIVANKIQNLFATKDPAEAVRILGATLMQDVTPIYKDVDISPLVGKVTNMNQGDTIKFKTKKGLVGAVHAKGSYAERTQWSADYTTLTGEFASVNAEALLQDLQSGRIGSLNELQADSLTELNNLVNTNLYNTIKASISGTNALATDGDNYAEIANADWEAGNSTCKTAVNAILRQMSDKGGAVAFLGRIPAVGPLTDLAINTASTISLDEAQNFGVAGRYRNVPIIGLQDNVDRGGTSRVDSDTVFVIGQDAIQTFYVGGVGSIGDIDSNTLIVNFHVYREYAVVVMDQTKIFKININP